MADTAINIIAEHGKLNNTTTTMTRRCKHWIVFVFPHHYAFTQIESYIATIVQRRCMRYSWSSTKLQLAKVLRHIRNAMTYITTDSNFMSMSSFLYERCRTLQRSQIPYTRQRRRKNVWARRRCQPQDIGRDQCIAADTATGGWRKRPRPGFVQLFQCNPHCMSIISLVVMCACPRALRVLV